MRYFFTFFVTCFFFLSVVQSVFAQEDEVFASTSAEASVSASPTPPPPNVTSVNITVSPIFLSLHTQPGVAARSEVKIRNNSTETEYLQLDLATFVPDATGARPQLMEFKKDDPAQTWLTTPERKFAVEPGEWKTLQIDFSPPKEAALSYYYALVFNRQTKNPAGGGQTALQGAPAILALTHVESPLTKKELQLFSFTVPKIIFEFLPVTFDIAIENTGNTFVVPDGNIFIDGNGKKDIAIIDINTTNGNVLPQSKRTFQAAWSDGFPVYTQPTLDKNATESEQHAAPTLTWDLSKAHLFRFGKYTANLLLVYDNGERDVLITSQQSFWVIPWRILLGAFVLLMFTTIGLFATVRPLIRKLRTRGTPPTSPTPPPTPV